MDTKAKRNLFLGVIAVLSAVIIIASIVIASRGPRVSPVELVSESDEGKVVNDLYEGEMVIPNYDIPVSTYEIDDFTEKDGIITYSGGESQLGINVSQAHGDINWQQVADSGIEFAMIRVGYRSTKRGEITLDPNFKDNIQGAAAAGLDVGVYFFSQAVSVEEAEAEATFVLEQIQSYQIQYPVAFYWNYVTDDKGELDLSVRTHSCTGEDVTGFIESFCRKISRSGRTASYYADKTMAYENLDLSKISNYDLWYSEYEKAPSFYYDYKMWQYTNEGQIPGISQNVSITLALRSYGS